MSKKAVILLSGGLDSTTTLAIAKSQGFKCYALTMNYEQRNHHELACAKKVAAEFGVVEHQIFPLPLDRWGASALTDHRLDVPDQASNDIPITYVPARNTVFLSLALAWAEAIGAYDIFLGVNAIDYSNYPDCRPAFIEAMQKVANLATREGVEQRAFKIHAPLIDLTKADIIAKGTALGVDYAMTLSCYDPSANGAACGQCDACRFRAAGFQKAKISDVTRYSEG